ncbi:MAG: WYL domain-containing protein [Desulfuromonadaceae bacterium]|nr:WYL domain-containing protein [Desulfuromonadaceae bacterium]
MDTLYRHWLILRMIPRHRRIATTDIHSRLQTEYGINTTLRTIQRDLIALEASEFPLACDGNRPAGWSWRADAPAFDIPNMDPVTALTFKLTEKYLTKMFPSGALVALQPYIRSASERLNLTAESTLSRWPNKVRVVSRNLTMLPPVIMEGVSDAVYLALLEERRFKAEYRTMTGRKKTYEVNPLGMAFVDGLTYVIASLNEHQDPILLLLHRIQKVELLDKPVSVPVGFDLDEYITRELRFPVGGKILLVVHLFNETDMLRLKEAPISADQNILPPQNGVYKMTASVEDTLQLHWWLQGFGSRIEVIGPDSLREIFVKLSQELFNRYNKAS